MTPEKFLQQRKEREFYIEQNRLYKINKHLMRDQTILLDQVFKELCQLRKEMLLKGYMPWDYYMKYGRSHKMIEILHVKLSTGTY